MPTVKYTNDPAAQGQSGTVYAPDLPWWVSQPQPDQYTRPKTMPYRYGYRPPQTEAPETIAGATAGDVNVGVAAATPGGGRLSLSDVQGGFTPTPFRGGAKETSAERSEWRCTFPRCSASSSRSESRVAALPRKGRRQRPKAPGSVRRHK